MSSLGRPPTGYLLFTLGAFASSMALRVHPQPSRQDSASNAKLVAMGTETIPTTDQSPTRSVLSGPEGTPKDFVMFSAGCPLGVSPAPTSTSHCVWRPNMSQAPDPAPAYAVPDRSPKPRATFQGQRKSE